MNQGLNHKATRQTLLPEENKIRRDFINFIFVMADSEFEFGIR